MMISECCHRKLRRLDLPLGNGVVLFVRAQIGVNKFVIAFLLMMMLQGYATECGAQDMFINGKVHRDIPQYVDSRVFKSNPEPMIDMISRLREQRGRGDEKAMIGTLSAIGCELDLEGANYPAERYHHEALEISKKIYPADSAEVAAALHNLAVNLEFQKRYDDAIANFTDAEKIFEKQTPVDLSKCALEQFGIGRCLDGRGNSELASSSYKKAAKLASDPSAIKLRVEILRELTRALDDMNDPDLPKYQEEVKAAEAQLPPVQWKFGGSGPPTDQNVVKKNLQKKEVKPNFKVPKTLKPNS
jgi:tetratricopeptide (TPR) repeat protein